MLASILNQVSQQMTKWISELGLEYSPFPLRLDLKKLTIVADTPTGPVPMVQMGSSEVDSRTTYFFCMANPPWLADMMTEVGYGRHPKSVG